jgi:CRISPR system Cascade subunit CasA
MDRLAPYLDEQREAFDLLHHSRPFYQTRGLPKEYEADGVGRLVLERSNYGAAALLFQHRPVELAARDVVSFADAARNLVALHAFAPGGLVKKSGEPGSGSAGPMNRGAYVAIRGDSLFETLMFNLMVYDPENGKPIPGDAKKDKPAWEQFPLARPTGDREPKRTPHGYIDWLTWQSRRVELALSPDGSAVQGVVYCVAQGVELPPPQDPMLAFRVDKERGMVPIDFSESRALWRDCHAFVRETGQDGAAPPATVCQLATALRGVLADATPSLLVLGMRGDQAAIKISRAERLVVPGSVLADRDLQARLLEASTMAEAVGKTLRSALRIAAANSLSPGAREPHKDDISHLVDAMGSDQGYWAALASPFGLFLHGLTHEPNAASDKFRTVACRIARQVLQDACAALGSEARHLKALACAESYLARELSSAVPLGVPS